MVCIKDWTTFSIKGLLGNHSRLCRLHKVSAAYSLFIALKKGKNQLACRLQKNRKRKKWIWLVGHNLTTLSSM